MEIKEFFDKFYEENPKWGIAKNIAELLRKVRNESGLTQHELAKKMHTKQTAIARAESINPKFTPTLPFIRKFVEACGRRMKLPEVI